MEKTINIKSTKRDFDLQSPSAFKRLKSEERELVARNYLRKLISHNNKAINASFHQFNPKLFIDIANERYSTLNDPITAARQYVHRNIMGIFSGIFVNSSIQNKNPDLNSLYNTIMDIHEQAKNPNSIISLSDLPKMVEYYDIYTLYCFNEVQKTFLELLPYVGKEFRTVNDITTFVNKVLVNSLFLNNPYYGWPYYTIGAMNYPAGCFNIKKFRCHTTTAGIKYPLGVPFDYYQLGYCKDSISKSTLKFEGSDKIEEILADHLKDDRAFYDVEIPVISDTELEIQKYIKTHIAKKLNDHIRRVYEAHEGRRDQYNYHSWGMMPEDIIIRAYPDDLLPVKRTLQYDTFHKYLDENARAIRLEELRQDSYPNIIRDKDYSDRLNRDDFNNWPGSKKDNLFKKTADDEKFLGDKIFPVTIDDQLRHETRLTYRGILFALNRTPEHVICNTSRNYLDEYEALYHTGVKIYLYKNSDQIYRGAICYRMVNEEGADAVYKFYDSTADKQFEGAEPINSDDYHYIYDGDFPNTKRDNQDETISSDDNNDDTIDTNYEDIDTENTSKELAQDVIDNLSRKKENTAADNTATNYEDNLDNSTARENDDRDASDNSSTNSDALTNKKVIFNDEEKKARIAKELEKYMDVREKRIAVLQARLYTLRLQELGTPLSIAERNEILSILSELKSLGVSTDEHSTDD